MSLGKQRLRIRNMRERKLGIIIVSVFFVFLAFILWNWIETCYRRRQLFDLYFPATVQGLSVGSNVIIDGHKIGQVESIRLRSLSPDFAVQNYAVVTIYADVRELWNLPGNIDDAGYRAAVEQQIKYGLRGRLKLPSLIADGLCVELFYDREKTAFFVDDPLCENIEIPTYSGSLSQYIDQINARIEEYKLRELSEKLLAAEKYICRLNDDLSKTDFKKLGEAFARKTEALRKNLESEALKTRIAEINSALENAALSLESEKTKAFFENYSKQLKELSEKLVEFKQRLSGAQSLEPDSLPQISEMLNRYGEILRECNAELRKYAE